MREARPARAVGTTLDREIRNAVEVLKKKKIKHNVLNARYHEQEAYIIAQAGVPGAVTIATNMAGHGTDIHSRQSRNARRRRDRRH